VETTPCIDCGASERSLDILRIDIEDDFKHDSKNYALYRAFGVTEEIFCNFCPYEFTSYSPEFYGFDKNKKFAPTDFQFLKQITEPEISKDKFCKSCNRRLAFLLFTKLLREKNYA